ncbi:hypothetical protein [Candidatus Endomicrobiellum trichonymphae]|uniref:hypothetical protein n=1 Tax=Endomicrobium trichonymphae TaxID=1408204 RepID=UPI000866480A|nr:hypothetical protein [Candidatus Endomicrobium trichonymphae]BAV59305.1 hypothetical protein RSTT_P1-006 [Candidatus Endomicrobium trichonymphae]
MKKMFAVLLVMASFLDLVSAAECVVKGSTKYFRNNCYCTAGTNDRCVWDMCVAGANERGLKTVYSNFTSPDCPICEPDSRPLISSYKDVMRYGSLIGVAGAAMKISMAAMKLSMYCAKASFRLGWYAAGAVCPPLKGLYITYYNIDQS